jgi:WD40 repeat protein
VAFTLAGNRLITLSGSTIVVWLRNTAGTYDKSQSLTTSDTLSNSDISPNGQKIAAAGTAASVYVWRFNNSTQQYEYSQKLQYPGDSTSQTITVVTFNRLGDRLITGSTDGSVNIWVINTSDNGCFGRQYSNYQCGRHRFYNQSMVSWIWQRSVLTNANNQCSRCSYCSICST